MAPYTVRLLDARGNPHARLEWACPCDDDAIDAAGSLEHPHAIEVWDGERLVARFPPLEEEA